jgi:hypothetical protein
VLQKTKVFIIIGFFKITYLQFRLTYSINVRIFVLGPIVFEVPARKHTLWRDIHTFKHWIQHYFLDLYITIFSSSENYVERLPLKWQQMCIVALPDTRVFGAGGATRYDDGSISYRKAWISTTPDLSSWKELANLPINVASPSQCGHVVLANGVLEVFVYQSSHIYR